jgi:hypothetical protein
MFVTDEAEHPFKTLMWESAQRSWIYSLLETDEAPSFIFLLTCACIHLEMMHHYSDMMTMARSLI